MAGEARTVRALAEALKAAGLPLSKSRIGQLVLEEWWPPKGPAGWDVEACRAAYRLNVTPPEERAGGLPAVAASPPGASSEPARPIPPAPPPKPLDARAQALVDTLRRDADPLDMARAAVRLVASKFADGVEARQLGARAVAELTDAMEELRRTEAACLEQARKRGDLIERDVAKAVAGALARRYVLSCERIGMRFASQVELWIADEAFREATSDERGLAVAAWAREQTRQARLAETDDEVRAAIEALVVAELEDLRRG